MVLQNNIALKNDMLIQNNIVSGANQIFQSNVISVYDSWLSTTSAGSPLTVWYVDVMRDQVQWEPLLMEVKKRLQGKVATSATLKLNTAFAEQIRLLVPWKLHLIQLVRTPKVRRLPLNMMLEKPVTHRGAALLHNTGQISIETETVEDIANTPSSRYETPVAYGILFYGEAASTSFNPEEDRQPEEMPSSSTRAPRTPTAKRAPKTPMPKTPMPGTPVPGTPSPGTPRHHEVHQPTDQEVTFPGVSNEAVPPWIRSVLKRLHTNLGHPSSESLVRHLAAAGASGPALHGAKHLRCATCLRTKPPSQPRPSKSFQARRFNDRLMMDIIFVKDITRQTHAFLNQLDDGTTFQVITYLDNRAEPGVIQALVQGWFRFFGVPDEVLLDAEGAFKGFDFEQFMMQSGCKMRFVPADAHWQLGKCERHGAAAKLIMKKLIHQFAVTTKEELILVATFATDAKNSLARRSGASPAQWVFGRNPRIPSMLLSEPEAIEAKQMIDDSAKLAAIERMRHTAMVEYLNLEHSEALRKAILRRSRPWRGPLQVGQKVAYFRHKSQVDGEGSLEGYRQGLIIGLDPGPAGSVWIRNNRGRLVQVAREQVRGIEGEEIWTPSTEDIKMLKQTEKELAAPQVQAHAQRGPPPQAIQDRLVLDAVGEPVRQEPDPMPIFALLPPPVETQASPAQPALVTAPPEPQQPVSEQVPVPEGNSDIADEEVVPITAPAEEPQVSPQLALRDVHAPSQPHTAEQGTWFLDPDGRPCLSVDNAVKFKTPKNKFDMNEYKYRSSWSYTDGNWQKLEEGVDMTNMSNPEEDVPAGPVDRLVMTFSPSRARGQAPSIASARGIKRSASDTGLPERPDLPADEPQPAQTAGPAGVEQDPAEAAPNSMNLLLYCRNCGCQQFTQNAISETSSCARCCNPSFVNDPRKVISWFDEVEEHQALQLLKDQVAYNVKAKTWQGFPLANVNEAKLPADCDLDSAYEHESSILDIGQVYRDLPSAAEVAADSVWSVAVKFKDEPWEWKSVFDSIHVAEDTLAEELPAVRGQLHPDKVLAIEHHGPITGRVQPGHLRPRRREHDWLRRHGRHGAFLSGWDGSPPELQPMFETSGIECAYHCFLADVSQELEDFGETALTKDPAVIEDAQQHSQDGHPSWAQQSWNTTSEPSITALPPTEMNQVITGPESESEDEEAGDETSGRALKQALKREIPWRTIRDEDRAGFVKAMIDEWEEWCKWSSCQAIRPKKGDIPSHLVLKSRVCYRWKPKDGGRYFKPKARIVVQGYQDPHLPLLSRDAPVLAKSTLVLIVQWAAMYQVSLWNGDCKSAFLQGEPDTERPVCIYMRPPRDPIALEAVPDWLDEELLYQLTAPVYGQANAPRRWYLHVLHTLQALQWVQHSLDPCLFLQKLNDQVVAVLGVHVDDVILCCLPGFEFHLDKVRESFVWGSEWERDSFVFVGRQITRCDDGSYTMDQTHYSADISKTRITMDVDTKLYEHPELVTEFRSGIGSLQWMAGTTRGDLASDVSLLQKPPKELTVGDLKEVNRVLKYVKATANAYVKINHVKPEDAVFIAYGDSGWANAPGGKSQGGLVITMSDKGVFDQERPASLLEWKSYRHQRILRSTLAAEAASLDRAVDMGNFMACVFSEMIYANYQATCGTPMFQVIPVTDARSLWDSIHRLSTSFAEKRVEIDVAGLRQTCRGLRWVPTEMQWADALTKRCPRLRDGFRRWAMDPVVTLVESRCAEEGTDNAAWRQGVQPKEKHSSETD